MSPIYVPGKVTLAKDYTEGDRYFSNVSLLLHGDGTNGSTTITDSSPSPKTVTAVGNAQISTEQSKFGQSSYKINTGYLRTSTSVEFAFGTGDYTVEFWFYLLSGDAGMRLIQFSDNKDNLDCNFDSNNSGKLNYYNGTYSTTSQPNQYQLNTWNHLALVRSAGTARVYINGIISITQNSTPNTVSARYLGVGGLTSPLIFNGYIDDLRITKGVARYTSNFTPPTAPFADAQY